MGKVLIFFIDRIFDIFLKTKMFWSIAKYAKNQLFVTVD